VAVRIAPLLASPLLQPSPSQGGGTPALRLKLTHMGDGGEGPGGGKVLFSTASA